MSSGSKQLDILLVEDDLSDALLIMQAFRDSGFSSDIHHVRDGADALDYLNKRGRFATEKKPNLVVLDLNMPRRGGDEVLREIRKDEELKRLPVVIFTTSRAPEDIIKAYDLHANSYVIKPHDYDGYQSIVKEVENFWARIAELPPR